MTRIGAIRNADKNTVYMFGFWVYGGEEVPPEDVMGPVGIRLGLLGRRNPKLIMDDGTVIWGCESWWGGEEKIRAMIGARQVVLVMPERSQPTNEERSEVKKLIDEIAQCEVPGAALREVDYREIAEHYLGDIEKPEPVATDEGG